MTDYITFVHDVAEIVLDRLPLQSLDSAISLVYAYISDVGGWVPDDPMDPQGDGAPANGFSEDDSANDITDQQFRSVYDLEFNVTVTLKVQAISKLTEGLTLSDAAASMANQVSDFITDTVNKSRLPVWVLSTSTQNAISGDSLITGYTTQSVRGNIQTEITNNETTRVVDYKAIALMYVQDIYGVDDTWNVWASYVQPDNPIVVMIKRYLDNTYAALDNSSTTIYVINISPISYQVVAGVIID